MRSKRLEGAKFWSAGRPEAPAPTPRERRSDVRKFYISIAASSIKWTDSRYQFEIPYILAIIL